jgi:hypothetical protein
LGELEVHEMHLLLAPPNAAWKAARSSTFARGCAVARGASALGMSPRKIVVKI